MDIHSTVKLNNGVEMPRLGFGTFQLIDGRETENAVRWALQSGYRHVDTARVYRNESSVGKAVRESGLDRKKLFVTTKLTEEDFADPRAALEESLQRMQLDFVDLFLIHFPFPKGRIACWNSLEKLYDEGLCKSIGVSNFTVRHLNELLPRASVVPAVNQVEFSPYLNQQELAKFCQEKSIQLECYSPLTRAFKLRDPKLLELAKHYHKTPAQLLIHWALQHDFVVLPKSKMQERIAENADVFDFSISPQHMKIMGSWNENYRTCWDPTNAP